MKLDKARVAVLTAARKIEVKEFELPDLKDDEILVEVEGCGICGTDVHEWKGDPFGLIPVVLGHEGSGKIVAMGKNVKCDTNNCEVKIGDEIVTSVMHCSQCPTCRSFPDKTNLCDTLGVYGLIPDSEDYHLNGWFASHIVLRKGATFFNVTGMSLKQRLLVEPAAVAVHAIKRATSTNLIDFGSVVMVQGCGPIGLMVIAALNTLGVKNIVALDGVDSRLKTASDMGAKYTVNFKKINTLESRLDYIQGLTGGKGADFAFQCTGVPAAASEVWKYVRRGGGLCELGFFVNNGECQINPHFDMCAKEITAIGSWVYTAQEYPAAIEFVKKSVEIGIPLEDLVTHTYPLDQMNEAMEKNLSLEGIKIAFVA